MGIAHGRHRRGAPLRKVLAPLAAAGLLAASPAALAFRCGNMLVSEGDPADKIRHYCGEPVSIQRRVIYRSGITRPPYRYDVNGVPRALDDEVVAFDRSYVEVLVEEWTYNFGPRRLLQVVRFEDGVVVEISSNGYGYRD